MFGRKPPNEPEQRQDTRSIQIRASDTLLERAEALAFCVGWKGEPAAILALFKALSKYAELDAKATKPGAEKPAAGTDATAAPEAA